VAHDDGQSRQPGAASAAHPSAFSRLLEDLAAVPPAEDAWRGHLSAGQVIGRFELVRELGRGGFGVVWEALDRELGRAVAFKAVRPGLAGPGQERLHREAEAIARLSHPNLVTLFDAGTCEHGPYLVLELLRGQTLEQRLALGAVPLAEALRIAAEVARGVAHAHAGGVVHRDLKPSNVHLGESGAVKVLDFGMAHAFGRRRAGGGTPAYMAPEQWRGAPEDERTDVFAMGVMLHQLLTGVLPFDDEGQAFEAGRAAPELDVPGAPAVGELAGRMLALDPVARPRHAGEVLEALLPLLGEASRSSSTGTAGLVRRRRPWRRAAALTTAGALAGLVAGAALVWRGAPAVPDGPPTIAVLPLDNLSADRDDQYFAEGIHGELITQLARMHGLRVIARGSVQAYRGGERDLKEIARTLGVTSVLEGTVQRAGGRVRVQAQLVDPRTGHQLWADRFDRDAGDVFALQTEVALQIAGALGARLSEAERQLVERPPTRDAEAYERYRRGLALWQRSMGVDADNAAALVLFEEAVERDPGFALAHAQLAVVLSEWKDDCEEARQHAEQAAALDRQLPQAHFALGHLRYDCEQDPQGAIRELRLAVGGAPGDAVARSFLGLMLSSTGAFTEGLAEMDAALTLDPRSYLVAIELARQATFLRRYDLATRGCQKALAVAPSDPHALVSCALVPAWRDGDLEPARRVLAGLTLARPAHGDSAMSLLQLLTFLPAETLERARAGRLPEPFASGPIIPRDYVVGCALSALGRAGEARAAFARVDAQLRPLLAASPGDALLRALEARADAGLGRAEEALAATRRLLGELREEQRRAGVLRFTAEIAAAAGRPEEALAALETVLARPDGLFTPASLRVDPRFASLHGLPRFERLAAGSAATAARR
jgi:eukaryotic-like serine/threonine-protein kinase